MPHIAILDMNMPGLNGMEILEKLQHTKHPVKSILLTMYNDVALFNKAKELGVKGYLLKDFAIDELEKCLNEVKIGNSYFSKHLSHMLTVQHSKDVNPALELLTFAEKKILDLVVQQKSTKDIAAQLFISEKTVETHRGHIIKKLNIPPGKNALLIWAMKMKG
jgi:DNA-binding NarL/FixJ family response regulator